MSTTTMVGFFCRVLNHYFVFAAGSENMENQVGF